MFNQFSRHEDAFRDWRRDGMPGLKDESYKYIGYLTSKDDDQLPREGTLWPHQWESFLRVIYSHEILKKPVIGLDGKDGEKKVRDYMTQLHPAAFELVYSDSSSPLPRKVKSIILGKSRIWYNTLWASLAGGHEDDQALKDPDGNYGYLIEELGARILQTDRPGFMLDYLRKKGLHD